jgi:hypothetical protein
MKILDAKQMEQIITEVAGQEGDRLFTTKPNPYNIAIAKAQADLTLQEIIEWGESWCDCEHWYSFADGQMHRYPTHTRRKDCLRCWELKKGEIK